MKHIFGKRFLALVLAFCLILAMVPVSLSVEAEAVSGVDSLTCSGFISNSMRRNYIDTMMKYYINNNSNLQSTLNNGLSVVFMFEGGSDNYDTYKYVDSDGTTRLQAVCIVVQMNSSGNAEIVFHSENCSSIPDDANFVTAGNETNGSTTILDGIYGFQTVNHLGNYAGFNTYCTTGWYNPYAGSTGYSGYCNGINLHTRSVSYCAGESYGWCNSAGCQVIGYGANSSNEYNEFVKVVAGINYNAYDGVMRTYSYNSSSPGTYVEKGYYVVDRQLGLLSPDGTEYGSGSLAELYTVADLAGITAFSTAARANADFDYASKCTSYPAYCQIKVKLDGAPINSQPCSLGTVDDCTTLESAAYGAVYTATGLFQNEYGNYWYRISTSSGETGYIYGGEVEYVKQLTSDIKITDYDTPDGHVSGDIFYVTGDISSSYNKLTNAAVWIHSGFGTSGSKVTGYSDTVGGYSYSLLNSTIDYNTAFNQVGTGNYTYAISVDYINYYAEDATTLKSNTGTLYLVEDYFVVVPSAVDQSSCSHSYTTTTIGGSICTDTVTVIKSCSTCGYITQSTSTGSHSYGSWTTTKAATCTASGTKTRTCSVCGNEETQTIAAIGHDYDMVTHEATCQQYETYEFTCDNCGDAYELNAGEISTSWIEEIPTGMDSSLFTSKTQYRYSDYETINSYEPSLDGYTLKSSAWEQSGSGTIKYVPSWPSGFDTSSSLYTTYNKASTKKTASETTTDKTVINSDELVGYLYYHWCSSSDTNHYSYAAKSSTHTIFHAYYSTSAPDTYTCDTSDMSYKTSDSTCSAGYSAWFFVTEVYAQKYTAYKNLFTYERWTDCSDWSDTVVAASDTRKVETRTVYQLKSASLGDHVWSNGSCTVCGTTCNHNWNNGKCSVCGVTCNHSWNNGKCSICGVTCSHSWNNGKCAVCGITCSHSWSNGKCVTCGIACSHSWSHGSCSVCGISCGHNWADGICTVCGLVCEHSYVSGVCSVCGEKEPNQDYYLFGYINGADYACEGDYVNIGEYKFTDGKLVATFEQNSYVAVKTGDNASWYMTDGWLGTDVNSAVLYNTSVLSAPEKLYVPGGVEVTFTLVDNGDGTVTLSYVAAAPEVTVPTIGLKYPTLVFEDEVMMNVYFSASELGDVEEIGLITYSSSVTDWNVNNAENVVPGYTFSDEVGYYYATTAGIAAKELGDTIYFSVYAKLTDGSYYYSKLVNYSPSTYAYNLVHSASVANDIKSVVVAMLNYGAAAQTFFGYKTDNLVNSNLTASEQAMVEAYRSGMVSGVVGVDSSKVGAFANTGGFSKKYPSISFEGAFCINYYFTPSNVPDGDLKFYYWNMEDYNNATVLSASNATGSMTLTGDTEYWAVVEGIAAKELDSTYYVAVVYDYNGVSYCSGVLAYSIGSYCVSQAAGSSAMQPFAAATAVYGYYAKAYFVNN